MHMLIWIHLVALDNRFNRETPLFIVQLSILSHSHPLWCLNCKTKMALSHIPLHWVHFYFSLSSVPNVKNLIIFWSPSSPWPSYSSTTWHVTYHFMSTHLAQWLVPRFHQLSKTKLGLSISSFLVMDDNLFTKILAKMSVRCNGRKKNYQTLIANEGRILYMYLCFTLSINFKSSNLSYDDHITCIRRVSLV
jgi:hypothetical protein